MTMKLDLHYTEPRLVAMYDTDNPRGLDYDFFHQLAAEIDAQTIVDLGCGTGLLTREFVNPQRKVIGVDPSPAMLAYARQQPGATAVQWINGDASAIGSPDADLALMTGNVAQVFLEDTDWVATLRALFTALKPGGVLAFESRYPPDRGWERWNREATHTIADSPFGPLESWLEVVSVTPGRVRFEAYNIFLNSGETLVVESELRFRGLEEMIMSLEGVGFNIQQVYGDWLRNPLTAESKLMIFVAQRPES